LKPIRPKIEALSRLPFGVFFAFTMLGIFVTTYVGGWVQDTFRRK